MLLCLHVTGAALLVATGGCAQTPPPPMAAPPPVAHGTILAVRDITNFSAGGVTELVLGAHPPAAARQLAEYIVRLEDGRLISVVQERAAPLPAGAVVAIIRGDQTSLQPV